MESGEHEADHASAQACLLHCKAKGLRLAQLIGGNKCSCSSMINHAQFEEAPSGLCSHKCQDETSASCGGDTATALYVAGHIKTDYLST